MMKKTSWLTVLVLVVSILFSGILTYIKLEATPPWFNGILENNHALLLDFNFTNNEQSRLFQFYIPEFFHRLFGLSVINSYILQRFVFTTLTFIAFFYYSKKWFTNKEAFLSLLVLLLITPVTIMNDLQESSTLLSLTFLGALWAIRDKKNLLYLLILLFGSINNETMLFMPAVYFFFNFKSFTLGNIFTLSIKTIILALPAIIIVGIIRYINIDRPHLGGALHFYDNILSMHRIFWIFNIMWLLAILYYRKKPLFIQRALLTIPLFILPHMITGIIAETRQMLPLAFIIIPASLFTLLEIKKKYFNSV